MNRPEAVRLCRLVAACCPAQKLDEFTPQAWGDLLADIRYADAELAVKEVAKRQPFVSPSEIIAEVKRVRARRIDEHPVLPPADMDPDDEARYREWLAMARRAVADGHAPVVAELSKRDLKALEGAFKGPDDV
jgi:hypothetical protein